MDQITVAEAAEEKGCSGQAVRDAIRKGLLEGTRYGTTYVIKVNKKYRDWSPNPNVQKSGYSRWGRKTKKAKRGR